MTVATLRYTLANPDLLKFPNVSGRCFTSITEVFIFYFFLNSHCFQLFISMAVCCLWALFPYGYPELFVMQGKVICFARVSVCVLYLFGGGFCFCFHFVLTD